MLFCDVTGEVAILDTTETGRAEPARQQEFGQFMTARWPGLVRLAYGLTGDRWLAVDIAQAALASAYAAWWRVRRADDPDAYVRRIVVNANRNRFRKTRVSELLTDSLPELSAADEVGRRDDRAILIRELMRLSHGQRAAVVLRYWLDLSEAETAAVLGCSVGNVKSQAARGLAKLRTSAALLEGGLR